MEGQRERSREPSQGADGGAGGEKQVESGDALEEEQTRFPGGCDVGVGQREETRLWAARKWPFMGKETSGGAEYSSFGRILFGPWKGMKYEDLGVNVLNLRCLLHM